MDDKKDDLENRVRLRELKVAAKNYYTLRIASFDFQRRDGAWQHQQRESYDIGDAAAVLPFDSARGTLILIKQFRWPVFLWGYKHELVEVMCGKLEGDTPVDCGTRVAMER